MKYYPDKHVSQGEAGLGRGSVCLIGVTTLFPSCLLSLSALSAVWPGFISLFSEDWLPTTGH